MLDLISRKIIKWIRSHYTHQVYRYRRDTLRAESMTAKTKILASTLWDLFVKRKRILFYPDYPRTLFVIYKILLFMGYHITADPKITCDFAMKWRNSMDGNPFLPPEPTLEKLAINQSNIKFINMDCNDVTKMRVNKVFEETFGYSLSVNPEIYKGKCIMKSDWNGLHIGEILDCPTSVRKGNYVYQKLIHNEVEDNLVEDIRVPIFKNNIPFVYLKYRSTNQRLIDRSHTNKKVVIAEVFDVLSEEEIENVIKFCEKMKLDYGEIDVLRDKHDDKIYIVDVNNNPAGPPEPINDNDAKIAVIRLAKAFKESFI